MSWALRDAGKVLGIVFAMTLAACSGGGGGGSSQATTAAAPPGRLHRGRSRDRGLHASAGRVERERAGPDHDERQRHRGARRRLRAGGLAPDLAVRHTRRRRDRVHAAVELQRDRAAGRNRQFDAARRCGPDRPDRDHVQRYRRVLPDRRADHAEPAVSHVHRDCRIPGLRDAVPLRERAGPQLDGDLERRMADARQSQRQRYRHGDGRCHGRGACGRQLQRDDHRARARRRNGRRGRAVQRHGADRRGEPERTQHQRDQRIDVRGPDGDGHRCRQYQRHLRRVRSGSVDRPDERQRRRRRELRRPGSIRRNSRAARTARW